MAYFLRFLYDIPTKMHQGRTSQLDKRNMVILQMYREGMPPVEIARKFSITPERIYQLIKSIKTS